MDVVWWKVVVGGLGSVLMSQSPQAVNTCKVVRKIELEVLEEYY